MRQARIDFCRRSERWERWVLRAVLVSSLLWISAPASVFGQTTFATITGAVLDPTGAVIVGAVVSATHIQSNYQYTAHSNEAGQYTLAQLREGEYVLRVQAPGFKEFVARNLQLVARDVRRLDVRLELGEVGSSVQVTAETAPIETETPRIGDTRVAAVLRDLPLNTRGLVDFIALTATVGRAGTTDAQRRYGGSRADQFEAQIDGISIQDSRGGNQISPLMGYIESYQEVRVDIANNSAEFGPIGLVTVISKSGTNEFHGTVFDYYSTPWLRARNPFSPTRGTGIRHWPGGSVGGPVIVPGIYNGADRTFFFFSFETSRGSAAQTLLTPTVPLPAWRDGDFSALAPGVIIRNPFARNAPFPGNRIPANRINPVSRRIQERFFPLPNFGDSSVFRSQNYRELKIRPFDPSTYWVTRIDHRFSDRAFAFGRYTWNRSYSRGFDGQLPTIGQREQQRDARGASLSFTYTIRPTLLNEFRWGLAYNDNPRNGPLKGKQIVQELGLQGLAEDLPDINGVFTVGFSGIALSGISQTAWRHPGFYNLVNQFQDQVSWFRGRHGLKAGFVLSHVVFKDQQASANLFGNVSFSNRFTGHPYSDFLLGIPTTTRRAFAPLFIDHRRWAYDFFITDQFKITPRLTLDMGLRYESRPLWIEKSGHQAIFDIVSGKVVVPDGSLTKVSQLMPIGYVDVVEARRLGLPGKTLLKTDRNNFAPRIGLAFRPWGERTVFRAGYGIFYDTVPVTASVAGVPFRIDEPAFTNPAGSPLVVLPQVFPASVAGPRTVNLPAAVRPDLRIPYSMQWSVTAEHQRWNTGFRLSYIGTNTRQGEWAYNINQPVADNRPFVDKPRRFPNYPQVNYLTNGAGHQYHAMTVEAERPLSAGLFHQITWTWARDIGDLEEGQSPEDAYDRGRERAVWEDIPTHRVTSALVYQLPFGNGRRWGSGVGRGLNTLIGGWQISAMYYFDSGQFLTPSWTGPDPTGTRFTSSRTPPQVTLRPNILSDPNLPSNQRSTNRWFDVGAFQPPARGSFGTSAKGVIKGPRSNVLHFGVFKSFDFRDRFRMRWELTATNVLNHPNWSNPNTNISALGQVGVITDVGDVAQYDHADARSLRAGLRLEW